VEDAEHRAVVILGERHESRDEVQRLLLVVGRVADVGNAVEDDAIDPAVVVALFFKRSFENCETLVSRERDERERTQAGVVHHAATEDGADDKLVPVGA
jgi:hypothetical protein